MIETAQNYLGYSVDDHMTWSRLMKRHVNRLGEGCFSKEYIDGFERLQFSENQISDIAIVGSILYDINGWSLVPVSGLIPARDFFLMLSMKRYPITVLIRKPEELDFSEQPDIFHDLCGHLPLLVNDQFSRFLYSFSLIGLQFIDNEEAILKLSRFFWYTYEMGLIFNDESLRVYGGAAITSYGEIENVRTDGIKKYNFDVDLVLQSEYNPFALQERYFVIRSFDELFEALEILPTKLMTNVPQLPHRSDGFFEITHKKTSDNDNAIGFLNDIATTYPNAISMAAGKPDESLFNVRSSLGMVDHFASYLGQCLNIDQEAAYSRIGQYSTSKGIIGEIISLYLAQDEKIHAVTEDIVVTVGAQEAFAIVVSAMCDRARDVVLIEDPGYIGVSSFCKSFDYEIRGVKTGHDGIDLDDLVRQIENLSAIGRVPKIVYVMADFQNPTGATMPLAKRLRLLELSSKFDFFIVEDGVYSPFGFDNEKIGSIKSHDKNGRVIYIGSFSKLLYPGLRLGFVVANQTARFSDGSQVRLSVKLAEMKAQITNSSSTISQAIVAGTLIAEKYSLARLNAPKLQSYREKHLLALHCLELFIGPYRDSWSHGFSWNQPKGGFFIRVSTPLRISMEMVERCARDYDVIFCPMNLFSISKSSANDIRISVLNLSMDDIREAIYRLSEFFRHMVSVLSINSKT